MDTLENWILSQCNQAGNQPELQSGTATKAAVSCNHIRMRCGPSLCLLISGVVMRLPPAFKDADQWASGWEWSCVWEPSVCRWEGSVFQVVAGELPAKLA